MPHEQMAVPVRPITRGPHHHFFGYYDKSPWSPNGRRLLALRSAFARRPPTECDAVTILLLDGDGYGLLRRVAQSRAWNWQQGNMLQWMPGSNRHIVYNARQGHRYVGVVMDVLTSMERVLPRPVYALSPRGDVAMSLSFERLAELRPGYGYYGLPDPHREQAAPRKDGIWWMNMQSGEHRLVVSLSQLAALQPTPSMEGARHWVNHIQFNTDGSLFAFFHRWESKEPPGWKTRLMTCSPDGSDLCCMIDTGKASHYDWHDPRRLLAWARVDGCVGYFLCEDRSGPRRPVGQDVLGRNGHCSWSPDRRWILTDTYPDGEHLRTLILYCPQTETRIDVGRFYSPPELAGEIRCDLHPRWNREGRLICVDSVHEGCRQMCALDVSEIVVTRNLREQT